MGARGPLEVTGARLVVRTAGGKTYAYDLDRETTEVVEEAIHSAEVSRRSSRKSREDIDLGVWYMHRSGLPVEHIARSFGMSENAVRSAIGRVRCGRYGSR
jgi:allophanate hydrolase subunit 1